MCRACHHARRRERERVWQVRRGEAPPADDPRRPGGYRGRVILTERRPAIEIVVRYPVVNERVAFRAMKDGVAVDKFTESPSALALKAHCIGYGANRIAILKDCMAAPAG